MQEIAGESQNDLDAQMYNYHFDEVYYMYK